MPNSLGRPIPDRVARRAHEAWEPSSGGCYISTYSTASHGYAQIGWKADGKNHGTTAHRAAWVHANGQIPAGITIDHLPTCDRRCVNVDHLRALTNYENARRTARRDWPLGECINGHSNSELVTYSGKTSCRLCVNSANRTWRERNREAFNEQQRQYRKRKRDNAA